MGIEFNASPHASLGVEVEINLVDQASRALANRAAECLIAVQDNGVAHPKLKPELFDCTVEAITGVCETVGEARADLEGSFATLRSAAKDRDLGLLSAGTHPFSDWQDLVVSPNERYARLLDQMQWPARRLAITGVHYHVGVRSAEKSIAVMNALTDYLPHFLALSSSSPFWHGVDTGMASARTKIFEGLPTAGLPPSLSGWVEFEDLMGTFISARAISTVREIWWDIRPHPDFGTIELRMCDAMPTTTEIVALAALAQSLVEWFDGLMDRGYTLPRPSDWLVRQNKWLAARFGLEAELILDHRGRRSPLRVAVDEVVDELMPVARRLGCAEELGLVRKLVDVGSSAERQRAVYAAGGSLNDVVDHLQREFISDEPGA